MEAFLHAILVGLSLCADCFAVALCSAVTIDLIRSRRRAGKVAGVFAVIQSLFFLAGWALTRLFSAFVAGRYAGFNRISGMIGCLLLLYVGGEMLVDGIRGKTDHLDLKGLRGILLGGIATSIDALGVGVSMALDGKGWAEAWPIGLSVFLFTALSVVAGMLSGSAAGSRLGSPARIAGGLVLIGLGIGMVL